MREVWIHLLFSILLVLEDHTLLNETEKLITIIYSGIS